MASGNDHVPMQVDAVAFMGMGESKGLPCSNFRIEVDTM